jgi:hypothetical protein
LASLAPLAANPAAVEAKSPGDVPGWFDFAPLYNRAVETAPPGSWLVEIGVFAGKSLRHLGMMAKQADKNLTVVGVDWGRGYREHRQLMDEYAIPAGGMAAVMMKTLLDAGLADDVQIILADSARAAKFVPDGACWMVFVDADHTHEGCARDIRAWWPKVAPGGVLAGHDWSSYAGVKAAVMDAFGRKDHTARDATSCWEVRRGVE